MARRHTESTHRCRTLGRMCNWSLDRGTVDRGPFWTRVRMGEVWRFAAQGLQGAPCEALTCSI